MQKEEMLKPVQHDILNMSMSLNTPINSSGRLYKMYAGRLEKLNIFTLEDLLYHFPFRYDDFSLISPIAKVQAGEIVTIRGTIVSINNVFTKNRKKIQKALVNDPTGTIEVTWYNQPFLTKYLHANDQVSLSGKVDFFGKKLTLTSPEYELLSDKVPSGTLHTGRLVPIYPETKGVSSKWLRRQVYKLLTDHANEFVEFLPDHILKKYSYPQLSDALWQIHFPDDPEKADSARERLGFDELLFIQIRAHERRVQWDKEIHGSAFEIKKYAPEIESFESSLPFTLTAGQKTAVEHMKQDMSTDKPMNRLVQGDVGSGKTIVGTYGMYIAYLNGFQSVLMAPTEILAQQHYATIKRLLEPLGVNVALATGSKKSIKYQVLGIKNKNNKKEIHNTEYLIHNTKPFDILIGTHAVLHESITFHNLGLVVIDEQQRFGVAQRSVIREKGNNPHFLTMTATPIPRTVALTMYGDLDISYIAEMPRGRKQIKTWLVPPEKRDGAYEWIGKQVKELNSQIFIICPFIEESENMATVKAATVEFDRLSKHVFPDLRLGMLHGKMKAKEKDQMLEDFRHKNFDILVATPVVEVGIDIPNATVILIEASERFGLAQLHQLRGRVGRGDKQSYCLLFSESPSPMTQQRLKSMETTHSGAELAEIDLRLRGPGDIFGTAQSGLPKLKIASFSNPLLVERTKHEAKDLYDQLDKFPKLKAKIEQITAPNISPD